MASQPPTLPTGWTVSNSRGSYSGPAKLSSEDEEVLEYLGDLDVQPDSPGWEDVEDDTETVSVQCLLCEDTQPGAGKMLAHCKEAHGFDLLDVRAKNDLDFFQTIKLVNYIRANTKATSSTAPPDTSASSAWEDDKYLQPVLEDDALLFSLDEILEESDLEKAMKEEGDGHKEAAKKALSS